MGLPFLDSFSAAARHGVWHADELGSADAQVIGTGHAALDAELPGGGWPVGAMTELLQTAPHDPIWPLLLPGLVQAVQARGGPVVLIGAPCEPFGASLAAHGLAPESLMWVCSDAPAARLWACEQALRCADVGAVLARLPQARVGELRRLQLAAAQHEALLFVCRPETVAQSASPARLRLHIVRSAVDAGQVELHILKRRGPPLATPVMAPARSERMSALLAAARVRRKLRLQQGASVPEAADSAIVVSIGEWKKEGRHALDRFAVVA
ncbi:translesion DNA synthesis-associated protein ImuA [Variovorax ureilyticus]|uniref:translesion DNA synthesis-associated protein ImuA n=1 Tax=Variovorax ureilyticus TaxID=1836198 RepID=UPI003D667003